MPDEMKPPAPRQANAGMAAAGAAAGVGAGALIMAVLQNYPGVIPQILNWGPAIFVIAGVGWFANRWAAPAISSQQAIGGALERLAATVEHQSTSQHDLVLAMQVNSDKLENVRQTLASLSCNKDPCPVGEIKNG